MAEREQKLIEDIDTFLTEVSMKPTRLGTNALGDPGFVSGLRNGRKVYSDTDEKVRAYMAAYRKELRGRKARRPKRAAMTAAA